MGRVLPALRSREADGRVTAWKRTERRVAAELARASSRNGRIRVAVLHASRARYGDALFEGLRALLAPQDAPASDAGE